MRDLPTSRDLLALARGLLLDEIAPLLPPERRRDAHLIATAIAIAARAAAGEGWQHEIAEKLRGFYEDGSSALFAPGGENGGKIDDDQLLVRFAAGLRNGAFETSPSRAAAARAILWRLTVEKLREGNPQFLAANGFGEAGGQKT